MLLISLLGMRVINTIVTFGKFKSYALGLFGMLILIVLPRKAEEQIEGSKV